LARTDPVLGESSDPIHDEFQGRVQDCNMVVAVELEAETETRRGRERPVRFHVKTTEFDRRVRDDDGELTDETETVVAPSWGFMTQAATNFGAPLVAYDESEAPINETPVRIERVGADTNTTYAVHGYPDLADAVDLSDLLANLEGISYLTKEELSTVSVPDSEEDFEALLVAAQEVGGLLLNKRLNELADQDRYDRIYEAVAKKKASDSSFTLDPWAKKDKKKAEPKQRSQRRGTTDEKPAQGSSDASDALEKLKNRVASR
jgi:hypothetical protein